MQNKNSIASMKSQKKRKENATPTELAAMKKYASNASVKSRKKRVANMTPAEREEYNRKNREACKKYQAKKREERMKAILDEIEIANQNKIAV